MAIEDGEPLHQCFPKHLRMGTARMKEKRNGGRRQVEMSENGRRKFGTK